MRFAGHIGGHQPKQRVQSGPTHSLHEHHRCGAYGEALAECRAHQPWLRMDQQWGL
jgi:hypothetical protein